MKQKIIEILIIMLLIGTAIQAIGTNMDEVEVPIWEIGDSWTYDCTFYQCAEDDSMSSEFLSDLTFEVVDIRNELYILEGTSESLSGITNLMGLDLKFTQITSYIADLHIRKSDLGISYHKFTMDGLFFPLFGSITFPLPIMMKYIVESDVDPVFLISPFPLFDGKEGKTLDTMIFQNAKLSLFNILTLAEFSDIVFPLGPYHYEVNDDEDTVEAGTFDVLNISFSGGGDYHYFNYASEVGNFVSLKSHITHGEGSKTYIDFNIELKSTNFE